MKIFNCLLAAAFSTGMGLVTLSATPAVAAPAQVAPRTPAYGYGPHGPNSRLRTLIENTQNDLRMANRLEPNNGDQLERYQTAQKNLSMFDRKLTVGKFDKGKLTDVINDLKEILKKNNLQVSSRRALTHDLAQFQIVKDRH
ncbi:MAG: hypothetical protein ACRD34_06235 [Bryobacteraceae bacterium]